MELNKTYYQWLVKSPVGDFVVPTLDPLMSYARHFNTIEDAIKQLENYGVLSKEGYIPDNWVLVELEYKVISRDKMREGNKVLEKLRPNLRVEQDGTRK